MKANDFRVTNFVNYNGEMFPIVFIGLDSVMLIRKDQSTFTVKLDRIKPISITDKILSDSKMIELCGCYYFWQNSMFFINKLVKVNKSTAWNVYATSETHLTEIRYIHELQNIFFSLCGEELVFSSTEP